MQQKCVHVSEVYLRTCARLRGDYVMEVVKFWGSCSEKPKHEFLDVTFVIFYLNKNLLFSRSSV